MKEYVFFDLDGTLANIDHRTHYVRSKPKNWKAFEKGIPGDELNVPVALFMKAMAENPRIDVHLLSGRTETSRHMTVEWLAEHGLTEYMDSLTMRPEGDYRPDHIIKAEFLQQFIRDYGQKPLFVVDDRPQVVRMWWEHGIFVFNVNQSDKEF